MKRQRGFTLIELLVVISIFVLVAALAVGFMGRAQAGNRNVGCMSNLHQIYQALKLYYIDEGGVLPFLPNSALDSRSHPCDPNLPPPALRPGSLGLWALTTNGIFDRTPPSSRDYALSRSAGTINKYLPSRRQLHCPADNVVTTGVRNPQTAECKNQPDWLNPDYNSYQVFDDEDGDGIGDEWTYQPCRQCDPRNPPPLTMANVLLRRQLAVPAECYDTSVGCEPSDGLSGLQEYRRDYAQGTIRWQPNWHPADETVVLWCPHHRQGMKPQDYDNVLFWDGRVQFMPKPGSPGVGWLRTPNPPAVP